MSMFDQIMKVNESSQVTFEPEIQDITIESAEDLNAATDIMEDALNITFENDMFMQRMNLAIISEEYEYLRNNGEELVWEGGKLASIRDTFIGWVKSFLGKIASLFKKAIQAIKDKANANTKWLKMKPLVDTVQIANGYDPECLKAANIKSRADAVFTCLEDALNKFSVDAYNEGDVKVENDENIKSADAKLKDLESDFYKQGQHTYKVVDAATFLRDYANCRKSLSSLYDRTKKVADGIIKDMKDMCKDEKKSDTTKEVKGINTTAVHKFISLSKEICNRGSKILNVFMKSSSKSNQLARAIVAKAAASSAKNDIKAGKKHEAASVFDTVMEAYI